MKISDGNKTVNVRMAIWNESTYSENLAHDFFDAGTLRRNDDGAYLVPDVDYCIEQAQEWADEDERNTLFVDA